MSLPSRFSAAAGRGLEKIDFRDALMATEAETTTAVPNRIDFDPEKTLYKVTTDYHWPTFNENATDQTDGWNEAAGIGYGPFGFGSSVKLHENDCMSDAEWLQEGDLCQLNPGNCEEGISFSVWEKMLFEENPLKDYQIGNEFKPKKYIVSTGADYFPDTGTAYPGFSMFRQGTDLVVVVSTGDRVWRASAPAQVYNNTWANLAFRFRPVNESDPATERNPVRQGGLEMYINHEKVAQTVLPEFTNAGFREFTPVTEYTIGGKPPAVMMIGCGFNHLEQKFDYHNEDEVDELALWSRPLVTNETVDETIFFLGGFDTNYQDVNPYEFKALLGNVDLTDANEFLDGTDLLERIVVGTTTTKAPFPTPTPGPSTTDPNAATGGSSTAGPDTTTVDDGGKTIVDLANEHLALQSIMSTMLDASSVRGIRSPGDAAIRYPLSILAAKLMEGDDDTNKEKWDAVHQVYPEEEGVTVTVRELTNYMLAWIGSANCSYEHDAPYYDPDEGAINYAEQGDGFVMYGKKLPVETYRQGPRLEFPDYSGPEWNINKDAWENPKDTFSVPTGMFKDQSDCNERDVTFSASIYNTLGAVMPKRRNMEIVWGDDWAVDAKVVVTGVSASADSLEYTAEDEALADKCVPDSDYMRDNPVRAELYHFVNQRARLTRRLLGTWFSDNDRVVGGIEVRHCVWWNENFGSNGAWDPNGCTLVQTDAEKTTCECSNFGSMTVLLERTTPIEIEDDCKVMQLVKYVGIGFSVVSLCLMALGVILGRNVWDMFHALRVHVGVTWSTALVLHVITDLDAIRDDPDLNLVFGFAMKFFYTASVTWMALEAHATFRAFTQGIVSGRNGVYRPFGYGTPFLPLGLLFLLYNDDLGVDPRCFVGWNRDAKLLYLLYNVGIAAVGCVFSIIIIFNLARPQTKRRNLVADLNSQARGTVIICFSKLIFWILATLTYTFNQESDHQDPYCLFVVLLGWFGFWMFVVLGMGSKKFRQGVARTRKEDEGFVAHFDSIDDPDDNADAATLSSTVSRPSSAAPSVMSSRPATAASRPVTASSRVTQIHEEDETDEHESNDDGSDHGSNDEEEEESDN